MPRYMLSYTSTEPFGTSNGNCEIRLQTPIRTMDDVAVVTDMLRKQYHLGNPVLLSFSRFDDAPTPGAS